MKTTKHKKTRLIIKKVAEADHSKDHQLSDMILSISERLDARLTEGRESGKVIEHNLEYGLGTEVVLREQLAENLPLRFGVAKGKLINKNGDSTRHLDLIIYDKLNFPTFYVDEHHNQILPIESAYAVIEVKARTSSSVLRDAFETLASVEAIVKEVKDRSTNEKVEFHPPQLCVFSFQDDRSLETILKNFVDLNRESSRAYSFSRYSKKSPGYKRTTKDFYLVAEIQIAGKGSVYSMLSGNVAIGRWGKFTFGLFVNSLISDMQQIRLPDFHPEHYLSWLQAGSREIFKHSLVSKKKASRAAAHNSAKQRRSIHS